MSTPGLFALGVAVTLIVAAALIPLFLAAIADGRYAEERVRLLQEQESEHARDLDSGPKLAA